MFLESNGSLKLKINQSSGVLNSRGTNNQGVVAIGDSSNIGGQQIINYNHQFPPPDTKINKLPLDNSNNNIGNKNFNSNGSRGNHNIYPENICRTIFEISNIRKKY